MTPSFFSSDEFAARRARVCAGIGDAYALVQAVEPVPGFEMPRQTNEFFYLTGIETPQAYLLIDGRNRSAALYLPHSDPHAAEEGGAPGAEDIDVVRQISGVEAVYPLEALTSHLNGLTHVYTPHKQAETKYACQDTLRYARKLATEDTWNTPPTRESLLIERLRSHVPGVVIDDLSPILDELRLIKSPREIDCMRRAGAICAQAVTEAMRSTQPGIYEYHLGAVADYVYRVNGVRYEGYRAIIANGSNIWLPHYFRNDSPLIDGDMVIMDYAPDVQNYTSDIGRMFPANGTFSPLQRELYGFILTYHKTLLQLIRPGVTPEQVLAEAAEIMAPIVEATPFTKPIYKEGAKRTLSFAGHLSHTVGMAVHDGGKYFGRPMQPGLVFALDPQMWIPEEKLYFRVEDTVVVTETGVEILTPNCPFDIDAIEALMAESGVLQQFPMVVA